MAESVCPIGILDWQEKHLLCVHDQNSGEIDAFNTAHLHPVLTSLLLPESAAIAISSITLVLAEKASFVCSKELSTSMKEKRTLGLRHSKSSWPTNR
eukprot:1150674-Pelagomonas_calceolata.AAC.2